MDVGTIGFYMRADQLVDSEIKIKIASSFQIRGSGVFFDENFAIV